MTERHLGSLIEDAESALKDLEILCQSFRAVEDQTKTFQSQCDGLLSEQKRLQTLADEVGTDLHFYAYLDNVTRRLNAPGAGRLVDDDAFGEILANLESCIAFMSKNVSLFPWHDISLMANADSPNTEMRSNTLRGINLY
jgi:conserved oligomeric Golgi complex subunit 3